MGLRPAEVAACSSQHVTKRIQIPAFISVGYDLVLARDRTHDGSVLLLMSLCLTKLG